MFGPLPAIGLVELVAELKLMPDVGIHLTLSTLPEQTRLAAHVFAYVAV